MKKSLCLTILLSLQLLSNATEAPLPPAQNQVLAHEIFKKIIEIPSVHERGTREVAVALANYFKSAGFAERDVVLIPEEKYPHQVNLLVTLPGKSRKKGVLWLAHLDVVGAKPENWSLPPFKFTEKDGYYYGRGATDMKDEVAAVAASLIRLKQEGYTPERDIIAAFTADEEGSYVENGAYYILRHHPDLFQPALVVNPDGGSGQIIGGKRKFFMLETSEKTYATFKLETRDRGGHSSEPNDRNTIYKLMHGLQNLSRYRFPYSSNETTRMYFKRMAEHETGRRRADMLTVAKPPRPDVKAADRLAKTPSINSLLHTTCVPTMLQAGHQENALPQRATALVQCRLMPGESIDDTQKTLERVLDEPAIKISVETRGIAGGESKPSDEILGAVQDTVTSMWPGIAVIPSMGAGASDSKYLRTAGIPCYGIGGSWDVVEDVRWHGRDERHEIKDFYTTVEFTYRLMKRLTA